MSVDEIKEGYYWVRGKNYKEWDLVEVEDDLVYQDRVKSPMSLEEAKEEFDQWQPVPPPKEVDG